MHDEKLVPYYLFIENIICIKKILSSIYIVPIPKTPLHYAAGNGHIEIVHLLLERGTDINAKDVSISVCFSLILFIV